MPRKTSRGIRKPLSPEARQKIAEAVKAAANKKREEDYVAKPVQKSEAIKIDIVKMDDQSFNPRLFEAMTTGKAIDPFFSTKIGIPRATNFLIVGDPGVGKSTVTMDILSDLQKRGNKVLFISAEMTRIDLFDYVKRYPKFGQLPILFLGEYLDDNPKQVIEEALDEGYDVVLVDSFAEVVEAVKETNFMSGGQGEKWLIDLMIRNNLGDNRGKFNTTFLCIQQVTKGGVFVGSNKLKHNTTGMLELRFDEGGEKAYMAFTKNRRGIVGQKLYFSLKASGDVNYEMQHLTPPASDIEEDLEYSHFLRNDIDI